MKLRASKCDIRVVTRNEEKEFLNLYHYQGYVPSKVCYGLYYDNELVELMTFGRSRYNRKFDWELLRLCTKKNIIVHGGASRLFKQFISEIDGNIISYCNESLFTGLVYSKLGFVRLGKCNSYHYEKDGKSYNRVQFQKHKLLELYPQYKDKNVTERQIMQEQGYTRVNEVQATWVYGDKWMIYRTTNTINGKTYIGQHRYKEGIQDGYMGSGLLILEAFSKYGKPSFTRETILDGITTQEEADKYERCAIFCERINGKSEYNLGDGGRYYDGKAIYHQPWNKGLRGVVPWNKGLKGYHTNKPRSSESKKKSSYSLKKAYADNPELRQQISSRMRGNKNAKAYSKWKCIETGEVKSSKEWLDSGYKVHRLCYKGLHFINLRANKKRTEEQKERISEAHKMSEDTKRRISETMKGRKPKCSTKGLKWWNNGIKSVRAAECPEGFVPGRL